ncbi:MAG: hypothetical protein GY694_12345, partial [Gammaproteobacteria bacterium]|nr:hypothetical protein [Gammaproteobacteria bacterium]
VDVSGNNPGDTICVISCSGDICDTTVIIIEPLEVETDTILITIPVEGTAGPLCPTSDDIGTVVDVINGNCDNEPLLGSTTTTDIEGCVIYTAGTTPDNNADTICIIGVDANGISDTTVYIITVTPVTDTIITPPGDPVCIDDVVTVGGTVDTSYSCDGSDINVSTNDSTGCKNEVDVSGNNPGDTICVISCSGDICDTTVIIIEPLEVETDTILITIPVE